MVLSAALDINALAMSQPRPIARCSLSQGEDLALVQLIVNHFKEPLLVRLSPMRSLVYELLCSCILKFNVRVYIG